MDEQEKSAPDTPRALFELSATPTGFEHLRLGRTPFQRQLSCVPYIRPKRATEARDEAIFLMPIIRENSLLA